MADSSRPKDYCYMGGFSKRIFGCRVWGLGFSGPDNKDSSIFESILGSPYLGKLPHELLSALAPVRVDIKGAFGRLV